MKLFYKLLLASISVSAVFFLSFFFVITRVKAAPPEEFEKSLVVDGLNEPTAFRFLPDGRILIAEKSGAIKVFANGQLQSDPLITLATVQTDNTDERGLLGIEPDPNFSQNGYLYVSYTNASNFDQLSRLTVTENTINPSSEVIYAVSTEYGRIFHHGGEVRFGPDGKLYWAMGMNGVTSFSQNLLNIHGKIHRFNADGSIPQDNPYYNDPVAVSSIWATGLRNPFRFDFLPDGRLIVGDVGDAAWEEVDIIDRGGNYGWPVAEGMCTSSCPYVNPIFVYPHVPNIGGAITATLIYNNGTFPSQYNGSFFYGDYANSFIRYLTFDPQYSSVISDTNFDNDAGTVVQLTKGPDGNMYSMTIYPGQIFKYSLAGGNRTPIAKMSAMPSAGLSPLTVAFSSEGSNDPDGTPLQFSWDFGNGSSSAEANPTYTYQANGQYNVKLTVSDGQKQATASSLVTVGNSLPTATITTPAANSKYNAGNTISYSGAGSDPEDGDLPDSAFSWKFVFHHEEHVHPFGSIVNGTKNGAFQIPTDPDNIDSTWYEIQLTVTDSGGLKTTTSTEIHPNLVNITYSSNEPQLQFTLDGVPHIGTYSELAVVGVKRVINAPSPQFIGGQKYLFIGWSDSQPQSHTVTTPSTNTTYQANYALASPLPLPWDHTDIGNTQIAGNTSYNNGTFILEASGADVWGTINDLQYAYQQINGDAEIVARIVSQQDTSDWAKAGVMIRQSQADNSPWVMLATTPEQNGVVMQKAPFDNTSGGSFQYPLWLKLTKQGDTITSYRSADGQTWTQVGSTTMTLAGNFSIGLFNTSHNPTVLNSTVFDNVSIKIKLPSPWDHQDIGAPNLPGSATYNNGVFTVKGAGDDIWGPNDQFHFVSQELVGNGEIKARIVSQNATNGWAKAGVMIKDSLTANSSYAMAAITPQNGSVMQYNFESSFSGGSYTLPNAWVKLKKVDNAVSAYTSTDGTIWNLIATRTVPFSETARIGLFTLSHNAAEYSTVQFDNVVVTPITPSVTLPSPWINHDIGNVQIPGSSAYTNGTYTLKGSGEDVWGSVHEFQYAHQTLVGDGEIIARITSQTNTSDWAKAGIMIKESTAANSPYVMLATTPLNGYAMQYSTFGNNNGRAYTFPNAWMKLRREGNLFSTFTSTDGVTWIPLETQTVTMNANATVGLFINSHNGTQLGTATFDNVSVNTFTTPTIPTPWQQIDVGAPTLEGSATFLNGTFTVKGSGNDIWYANDQFHYVYQQLIGDGSITARVTSQSPTDGWAKAGIMIKESTAPQAPNFLLGFTPENGITAQYNMTNNKNGAPYTFPYWVRLTRVGNTITAQTSPDGVLWTTYDTRTVPMANDALIGLFVTAHNGSQLSTVTFDNVTVNP